MDDKQTLVVNFFAGPGAGKTTCAWEVAAELKKRGIVTEYVPEYAKELIWDDKRFLLDGSFKNQSMIFKEQNLRVKRLIGKVDVVVTDSPIVLSSAYIKESVNEFQRMALSTHNGYNNFNLFINRGRTYEQAGRAHNLEQAKKIDEKLKEILVRDGVYFGDYYHETTPIVIKNIQKTLKKLQDKTKVGIKNKTKIKELER